MFISFEGIDGVGKSTQIDLLAQWLNAQGKTVVSTIEPGGTDLGVEIRHLLLHRKGEVAARSEALLYAADRAHHVATVIRPALAAGSVVITDRYLDSSVAYQGAARELDVDQVREISMWAVDSLLPDLTVLLDLPAEIAMTRRDSSGAEPDRLERERVEFFELARDEYLKMAAGNSRFLVLDASSSIDELQRAVRERVTELMAADSK
jgi:dTMP kinase